MPINTTCSCGKVYSLPASFAGQKATCKACGATFLVPTESDTTPDASRASAVATDLPAVEVLYDAHPAMFRSHPLTFTLGLAVPLLLVVLGLTGIGPTGLAVLGSVVLILAAPAYLVWWLSCRATRLTITDRKITLRRGLLSKDINEVRHDDIRNVRISQDLLQRLFRVGNIGLSTAGQAGVEIEVNGLPDPHRIREIINLRRR